MKGGALMGNRHFRALSVAVLAGAAICLSWWLCGDGSGIDLQNAESGAIPDPVASPLPTTKRLAPQVMTKAEEQTRLVRRPDEAASQPQAVPMSAREVFQSVPGRGDGDSTLSDAVRLAAEKSQLMDDLLDEEPIPCDYGQVMVGLFHDRSQDVYTRDFAVQHIGLYAEALHRRGTYDPSTPEAAQFRKSLDAAADETRTIIAAAAFRALDDLAAFDPHIDARRLDSRLVACAADASAAPAARVMAVQLCGERNVSASRSLLKRLADDQKENAVVRKSASHALRTLEGQ